MVDNLKMPLPAGAILATDDVLGVHVLRTKVQVGADGAAHDVSAANPMPVMVTQPLPAGDALIGHVEVANTLDVQLVAPLPAGPNHLGRVDVTELPSLPAGPNNIGSVTIGGSLPAGANSIGGVNVTSALPTGNNIIGKVVPNVTADSVGGAFVARRVANAGTSIIKSSAGRVYGWHFANVGTTGFFVKLFNATSITLGTTVSRMTMFVPAGGISELQFACGVEFNTGIGVAVTTTMADTATTLATSSSVLLMVAYR